MGWGWQGGNSGFSPKHEKCTNVQFFQYIFYFQYFLYTIVTKNIYMHVLEAHTLCVTKCSVDGY